MTVEERPAGATAPPSSATAAMIELVVGAYAAQAVCVVARLGVPDVLADGARPVGTIARQVGADEPALHRVLRALVGAGVVTQPADRWFALTELGATLRGDVPGSLRSWATLVGMPFWQRPWGELYEAVRSGGVPFDLANGCPFAEHVAGRPGDAEAFEAGMADLYTTRNVVGSYDMTGVRTVVEIGGGRGAVLAGILVADPGLRGVLVDTPEDLAGAEEELARAGVADRCRIVRGDVAGPLPAGGDVYLLSGMVHAVDDNRAVRILRSCRAAMGTAGRLLVAETVLPDGDRPSVGTLMDLQMLVLTAGGSFRTESELRSLLDRAGLRTLRTVPSSAVVTLLEAIATGGPSPYTPDRGDN